MRVRAIVPQNSLALAKSRLGDVLSAPARATLSLTLLGTICAALRATGGVEEIVIMTPDPDVRAYAAACGVRAVPDPSPGLNGALAGVFRTLSSASHGMLVVAGDLALLAPADVAAVLASGGARTLVLAPSKDQTGTNALLLPPGVVMEPLYGNGSRLLHRRRAMTQGLRVVEVYRPGLAFDLDTPTDLAALLSGGWSPRIRPVPGIGANLRGDRPRTCPLRRSTLEAFP